jgi:replication-associated recombination protein RarA
MEMVRGPTACENEFPLLRKTINPSTLLFLIARSALNLLDLVIDSRLSGGSEVVQLEIDHLIQVLQKNHLLYDKSGEQHYNLISALHKSMRGSDENAALYWLQRMLFAGEDPLYISRRLIRFASEDVGLADNAALQLVGHMETFGIPIHPSFSL